MLFLYAITLNGNLATCAGSQDGASSLAADAVPSDALAHFFSVLGQVRSFQALHVLAQFKSGHNLERCTCACV